MSSLSLFVAFLKTLPEDPLIDSGMIALISFTMIFFFFHLESS